MTIIALQKYSIFFQEKKTLLSSNFKLVLDQIIELGWPALKALICLKSNECNAGDICLYWHAILFEMDHVIKDLQKNDDISHETSNEIYNILHRRNDQLFGDGCISTAKDLFYAGAYLDPSMCQPHISNLT